MACGNNKRLAKCVRNSNVRGSDREKFPIGLFLKGLKKGEGYNFSFILLLPSCL